MNSPSVLLAFPVDLCSPVGVNLLLIDNFQCLSLAFQENRFHFLWLDADVHSVACLEGVKGELKFLLKFKKKKENFFFFGGEVGLGGGGGGGGSGWM